MLHSGYSSLRLESFLFTEQAFRDIKARLKPGGVFAMYNYYRQGWVVGRLERLAEKVFGTKPLVISLPYQAKIEPTQNQAGSITLLLAGAGDSPALAAIRERLARGESFWVHVSPRYNEAVNAFGAEPPEVAGTGPQHWKRIAPPRSRPTGIDRLPTDDWPFLYLRDPTIPGLNLRGMLIVAVLSLAILQSFAPARTVRPNPHMFFLGAGFMLLETKGVVHMALLFGSTWVVNSIVFFAILVMILLSNLFVLAVKPKATWPYYALLFASLAVNVAVPMTTFLVVAGRREGRRLVPGGLAPRLLRRRDLRDLVPRQPPARRRLRLEHRRRDPGRPEREPLAGRRVQQPAARGDRLLRALGDLQAARSGVNPPDDVQGSRTRPRRSFTLLDAMVLVAATAIGLAAARRLHAWIWSMTSTSLKPGSYLRSFSLEVARWIVIALPTAWAWTIVLLSSACAFGRAFEHRSSSRVRRPVAPRRSPWPSR